MKKIYTLLGLFFTMSLTFGQTITTLWNYPLPDVMGQTVSPAIGTDGTIYISCNLNSGLRVIGNTTPNFFAINTDGSLKWSSQITESPLVPANEKPDEITTSAAIHPDGSIYMGGVFTRSIFKLNPVDGSRIAVLNSGLGRQRLNGFAFSPDGTSVYTGFYSTASNRGIKSIKSDLSGKNWDFEIDKEFNLTPAVGVDGTIYAASVTTATNRFIYAINPDGTQKWATAYSLASGGYMASAISIGSDGTIYMSAKATSSPLNGVLKAYNPADGTEKWSTLITDGNAERGGPAIGPDGTIYLGNAGGFMRAYSPIDGSQLWSFTTSGAIQVVPAIDNLGRLYFGTTTGNFYVLNSDGTLAYDMLDLGDSIHSSAVIGSNGTIYVASTTGTGTNSGKLYALQTTATGLATSHWPMYGKSPMHTSNPRHFWTGATSNDWSIKSNWDLAVPSSGNDVSISAGLTNYPTATSAVTVNSVTINSGASLIAQDAFTGLITYNRNLPILDSWYLVSSPVSGETIEDLISNNTFASGTGPNIGFSTFNNTGSPWTYASLASTGSVVNGKGYSVRLATSGNIGFTGTANTSDVAFALTQGTNNFNLVGNPFTAYINSTTFLTNETANVELTFWMWNGTSYDTRTTGTHPNFKIAPGQAFFVEAKTTNNVTFTEALQSHETTDTFQKNSNTRPELKLTLSDGTQSRKLEVFYIEGTTKGFDNGFDGKMFGGVSESFSLYSELLAENVGVKYAVQSLPNSNLETMIVPVGVKAAAGKEITFTAEAMNLPEGINVYLEDKVANTVTLLSDTNATYKVTLSESLDGIGRFYIHTSATGVLGTDTIVLENVSVYATNNNTLRVVGLPSGNTNLKIFNILGKQMMQKSFSSNGVQDISLPKLATGMYIIQLETASGKLNKKIVLE